MADQRQSRGTGTAREPGADARRREQNTQRTRVEELQQTFRRAQEVERVARGRRVEHDRVVVVRAIELVELGDRRELV